MMDGQSDLRTPAIAQDKVARMSRDALLQATGFLPGGGCYPAHKVAMGGHLILQASRMMAAHVGRDAAAAALRRLADKVEAGDFD